MHWKVYRRKWSWSNIRYYPTLCLESPTKITKSLMKADLHTEIWTQALIGVLATEPRRSVLATVARCYGNSCSSRRNGRYDVGALCRMRPFPNYSEGGQRVSSCDPSRRQQVRAVCIIPSVECRTSYSYKLWEELQWPSFSRYNAM